MSLHISNIHQLFSLFFLKKTMWHKSVSQIKNVFILGCTMYFQGIWFWWGKKNWNKILSHKTFYMSSIKLNYAKLFCIIKRLYFGTQNEDSFLIIQYIFTLEGNIKNENSNIFKKKLCFLLKRRKMLKSKTLLLVEWPTLHWESIVHI